jgi:PTS system ascorbate-specific IIC component
LRVVIELLTTPAMTLGLVALAGLLAQRKPLSDTVRGTIKTVLGLLILTGGAGLISTALTPFNEMFTKGFGLTGVVPFDEAVIGALTEKVATIARTTSFILAFGFLINVLLARLTPFKYIFLTGHMMWILAGGLSWAFYDLGAAEWETILYGSILQGMTLTVIPALAQPLMKRLTESDELAYGHLTTTGVVLSAWVGKRVGDADRSSEEVELPKGLDFFRDTSISISLVMMVIYLVTALAAGPEFVQTLSGDQGWLTFTLLQAFSFAAGVLVLLQGVRMFLGEIVPAFRGIAMKWVPGAKPALDCPIVFPYAPTALMIGFLCCVAGMLVGMFASRVFHTVIPLPSIIGGFFTGGVAGIFGNVLGGRRGAAVSGFIYGLVLTIPVALFYPVLGLEEYGVQGIAFLVPDGILVLSVVALVVKLGVEWLFFVPFIALLAYGYWKSRG